MFGCRCPYNRFLGGPSCGGSCESNASSMTLNNVSIANMNIARVDQFTSTTNNHTNGSGGLVDGDFSKRERGGPGIVSGVDSVNEAVYKLDQWIYRRLVDAPERIASGFALDNIGPTSFQVSWVPPEFFELGIVDRTATFITGLEFMIRKATGSQTWTQLTGLPLPDQISGSTLSVKGAQTLPDVSSSIRVESVHTVKVTNTTRVRGDNFFCFVSPTMTVEINGEVRAVVSVDSTTELHVDVPFSTLTPCQEYEATFVQTRRIVSINNNVLDLQAPALFSMDSGFDITFLSFGEDVPLTYKSLTDPAHLPVENGTSTVSKIQFFLEDYHEPHVNGTTVQTSSTHTDAALVHGSQLQILARYVNYNNKNFEDRYISFYPIRLLSIGVPTMPRNITVSDIRVNDVTVIWESPEAHDNSSMEQRPLLETYDYSLQSTGLAPGLSRASPFVQHQTQHSILTTTHSYSNLPGGHRFDFIVRAKNTVNPSTGQASTLQVLTNPPQSSPLLTSFTIEFDPSTVATYGKPARRLSAVGELTHPLYYQVPGVSPALQPLRNVGLNDQVSFPNQDVVLASHSYTLTAEGSSVVTPQFAVFNTPLDGTFVNSNAALMVSNHTDVNTDALNTGFHAQQDLVVQLPNGIAPSLAVKTIVLQHVTPAVTSSSSMYYNVDDLNVVPTISGLACGHYIGFVSQPNNSLVSGVPCLGDGFVIRTRVYVQDLAKYFLVHEESAIEASITFNTPSESFEAGSVHFDRDVTTGTSISGVVGDEAYRGRICEPENPPKPIPQGPLPSIVALTHIDFTFEDRVEGFCTESTNHVAALNVKANNLVGSSTLETFTYTKASAIKYQDWSSYRLSLQHKLHYIDTVSTRYLAEYYSSPGLHGDTELLGQRIVMVNNAVTFPQQYHFRTQMETLFQVTSSSDWTLYDHTQPLTTSPYDIELQFVKGRLRSMHPDQASAYRNLAADYHKVALNGASFSERTPLPNYSNLSTNNWRIATFFFDVGAVSESLPESINYLTIEIRDASGMTFPVFSRTDTQGIDVFLKVLNGPLSNPNTFDYDLASNGVGATRWLDANRVVADGLEERSKFEKLRNGPLGVTEPGSRGVTTETVKRVSIPAETRTSDLKVFVMLALKNNFSLSAGYVQLKF